MAAQGDMRLIGRCSGCRIVQKSGGLQPAEAGLQDYRNGWSVHQVTTLQVVNDDVQAIPLSICEASSPCLKAFCHGGLVSFRLKAVDVTSDSSDSNVGRSLQGSAIIMSQAGCSCFLVV